MRFFWVKMLCKKVNYTTNSTESRTLGCLYIYIYKHAYIILILFCCIETRVFYLNCIQISNKYIQIYSNDYN